jgi:hypothetical protein
VVAFSNFMAFCSCFAQMPELLDGRRLSRRLLSVATISRAVHSIAAGSMCHYECVCAQESQLMFVAFSSRQAPSAGRCPVYPRRGRVVHAPQSRGPRANTGRSDTPSTATLSSSIPRSTSRPRALPFPRHAGSRCCSMWLLPTPLSSLRRCLGACRPRPRVFELGFCFCCTKSIMFGAQHRCIEKRSTCKENYGGASSTHVHTASQALFLLRPLPAAPLHCSSEDARVGMDLGARLTKPCSCTGCHCDADLYVYTV